MPEDALVTLARKVDKLEKEVSYLRTLESRGWAVDYIHPGGSTIIDFVGIPAWYRNLTIFWDIKDVLAATVVDSMIMRFNGDATVGAYFYSTQWHQGVGWTAIAYTAATFCFPGYIAAANSIGSGVGRLDIPDYSNTSFYKTMFSNFSSVSSAGVANYHGISTSTWKSTAAINRVTLTANGGNMVAGSRATIYAWG